MLLGIVEEFFCVCVCVDNSISTMGRGDLNTRCVFVQKLGGANQLSHKALGRRVSFDMICGVRIVLSET